MQKQINPKAAGHHIKSCTPTVAVTNDPAAFTGIANPESAGMPSKEYRK